MQSEPQQASIPATGNKPKKVVLMIADISGYTRYMLDHKAAELHGQVIITELLKTIIRQVKIPIEIAKLEGDAVFLYATKQCSEEKWSQTRIEIGKNLIAFFDAFYTRLVTLQEYDMCKCGACTNIGKLRLKIVVHAGEVLFYRIGRFNELAGVDVVIVHRLLKNSIDSDHYILLTEEAYNEIEFPENVKTTRGEENYDDVGRIRTHVHYPPTLDKYYVVRKKRHPGKPSGIKKLTTTTSVALKGFLIGTPGNRKGLGTVAFSLLFVCMFVATWLGFGIPIFLSWREGVRLQTGLEHSIVLRDSLEERVSSYREIDALYAELKGMEDKVIEDASEKDYVLSALADNLLPGMKLTGVRIDETSIEANCLSPSEKRLSLFVSVLSDNAGLETVDVAKLGVKNGVNEYRLTLEHSK